MVYGVLEIKEHEKKGTLWRPIKRLMAKARYVREMQKLSSGGHRHALPSVNASQGEEMHSISGSSNSECTPATNGASGAMGMNDMQSVLGMECLDPFMELFPDNFGTDIFGISQDYDNVFT